MISTTIKTLIQNVFTDSHTEEELKELKQDLITIKVTTDQYLYQLVNPKLKEFMYPNSEIYLNQVKEAFPKITWEVIKGDNFFNIEKKYENSDQVNIEFQCRNILKPIWYVDAPFISDIEFDSRPSFSTLEEAIEYLKAALLKVKQSIEELI